MLRTLGVIIRHLEGMEAVTNSQPVAQETTTDAPAPCFHPMDSLAVIGVTMSDPRVDNLTLHCLICRRNWYVQAAYPTVGEKG